MSVAERLKSHAAGDWHAAATQAFIYAPTDGSFDGDRIFGFPQQDFPFIERFVRLLASAVPRARTLAEAALGAQFPGLIFGSENTNSRRSLETLDLPQVGKALSETQALQPLTEEVRQSGRCGVMLSLRFWPSGSISSGRYLSTTARRTCPCGQAAWITLHSGKKIAGAVVNSHGRLVAVWGRVDDAVYAEFADAVTGAVVLERAFSDAALCGLSVAR